MALFLGYGLGEKNAVTLVSLPREWFQEIKRRTVHSKHGLFLTCTQSSRLYLHNVQLIDIYYIKYRNQYRTPCNTKSYLDIVVV